MCRSLRAHQQGSGFMLSGVFLRWDTWRERSIISLCPSETKQPVNIGIFRRMEWNSSILRLKTTHACSKTIKENKELGHRKLRVIALLEEKGWKKHLWRSRLSNTHNVVTYPTSNNKTSSDTHKPSKTLKVCQQWLSKGRDSSIIHYYSKSSVSGTSVIVLSKVPKASTHSQVLDQANWAGSSPNTAVGSVSNSAADSKALRELTRLH